MAKIGYALLISLLAVVVAMWMGCSKESSEPPVVVEEEAVEEVEVPALDTDAEPKVETGADADKVTAALASLGEADRAAVLAQKTCPVSDEALGSMGTPLKVTVAGRDVFICCEGCRDSLVAEPDKYLAKLDAAQPQ